MCAPVGVESKFYHRPPRRRAFASSAHFIRPDDFEEVYLATRDGRAVAAGRRRCRRARAALHRRRRRTLRGDEAVSSLEPTASCAARSAPSSSRSSAIGPDTSPEFLEAGSGLPPELLLAAWSPDGRAPLAMKRRQIERCARIRPEPWAPSALDRIADSSSRERIVVETETSSNSSSSSSSKSILRRSSGRSSNHSRGKMRWTPLVLNRRVQARSLPRAIAFSDLDISDEDFGHRLAEASRPARTARARARRGRRGRPAR